MKSNAIARIIIYSLLILIFASVLVIGLGLDLFSFQTDSETSSGVTVGEPISLEAADVSGLSIDWAAGSITIQTADTDQIMFSESGNISKKYAMVYRIEDGTLEIEFAKSSVSMGINNTPSKDLIITVPADWVCEELELDAAAVEVYVNGLTVGTLELDGAAAELTFNGSVDQMDIDGAAVKLEVCCTNHPYQIDIDGASCEMVLYLPEDCGFLLQMDSLSCSFNSDLDYTTRAGEYMYGNEACRISADGLSCNITVNHAPVVAEAE